MIKPVVRAFRAEFGRPEKKSKRNPWPQCQGCWYRVPGLCVGCRACSDCCAKCQRCGECALMCPGHEKEDHDDYR